MKSLATNLAFCLCWCTALAGTFRFDLPYNEVKVETVNDFGPVPLPEVQKSTASLLCLTSDLGYTFVKNGCPLIRNYARDIHKTIVDPVVGVVSGSCLVISSVSITVGQPCSDTDSNKLYPSVAMDEAYTITASSNGISIVANEVWGAMRALESLSQMVFRMNTGQIALYTAQIIDRPRFRHRGLMLDTSRHYLHKSKLIETLKLMAIVKLNVFHWHIVDDQSFPYSSTTFPDMADKGSYNPFTSIYTQEDVADVIEAGRRLGIRVIPEFDTPGHTQSWGRGLPQLLTKCYAKGKFNGNFGPIDPSRESNYITLSKLFGEILRKFPDSFLHLGGDEVPFGCWQSNPNITAFMKKKNITSYSALESYYVNQLLQHINSTRPTGKSFTAVVWQEVFDNRVKIPPNMLVHVWKNPWQTELASVTKAGYSALLSTCWYLNLISYGADFAKYYNCDPQSFQGTTAQKNLVLGGEATMWAEFVDDSNVISRTWPRVSSVAEALWTNSTRKNLGSFNSRIQTLQCRLKKLGYPAEPPNGPSTCARPLPVGPGN